MSIGYKLVPTQPIRTKDNDTHGWVDHENTIETMEINQFMDLMEKRYDDWPQFLLWTENKGVHEDLWWV